MPRSCAFVNNIDRIYTHYYALYTESEVMEYSKDLSFLKVNSSFEFNLNLMHVKNNSNIVPHFLGSLFGSWEPENNNVYFTD